MCWIWRTNTVILCLKIQFNFRKKICKTIGLSKHTCRYNLSLYFFTLNQYFPYPKTLLKAQKYSVLINTLFNSEIYVLVFQLSEIQVDFVWKSTMTLQINTFSLNWSQRAGVGGWQRGKGKCNECLLLEAKPLDLTLGHKAPRFAEQQYTHFRQKLISACQWLPDCHLGTAGRQERLVVS